MPLYGNISIEQFIASGYIRQEAEAELLPVPFYCLEGIDEEGIRVHFDFDIEYPVSDTLVPANPTCVFIVKYIDAYGSEKVYVEHKDFKPGVGFYDFYVPYDVVTEAQEYSVLFGYSPGLLGGHTVPRFNDRTQKTFFVYSSSFTSPEKYDYVAVGEPVTQRLLIQYVPNSFAYLTIGNSWKIGDGHLIGGAP